MLQLEKMNLKHTHIYKTQSGEELILNDQEVVNNHLHFIRCLISLKVPLIKVPFLNLVAELIEKETGRNKWR